MTASKRERPAKSPHGYLILGRLGLIVVILGLVAWPLLDYGPWPAYLGGALGLILVILAPNEQERAHAEARRQHEDRMRRARTPSGPSETEPGTGESIVAQRPDESVNDFLRRRGVIREDGTDV